MLRFKVLALAGITFASFVLLPPVFAANKEKLLHSFAGGSDGIQPYASLIFDGAGNLYGATLYGGSGQCGIVFRLSHRLNGAWDETILHEFSGGDDGCSPWAGLTIDGSGNLYGTTYGEPSYNLYGNVFQLSQQTDGKWRLKVLHTFTGGDGGGIPTGGMAFDEAGNLYGTAGLGGAYSNGVVFELSPRANGDWKEKVLHSFHGEDGSQPGGNLVFDESGNLYGTASAGGRSCSCGTVFELTKEAGGGWGWKLLHKFDGKDGDLPEGGPLLDKAGNLYGTAYFGGAYGYGSVYELSPGADGKWNKRLLHSFKHNGTDGTSPSANLILDTSGNLYSTTTFGGASPNCNYGCGTVFELSPAANGKWTEKVLYNFNGNRGEYPVSGLIFDDMGNLYGSAAGDAPSGCNAEGVCGAVFEVTP